jgi:hypothetical protein
MFAHNAAERGCGRVLKPRGLLIDCKALKQTARTSKLSVWTESYPPG